VTSTSPRGRLLIAVLALALGAADPAGAAHPKVVSLPWPPTVLPKTPPLRPATTGVSMLSPLFIRRVDNRERVVVGVDAEGKPQSIRVLHTIVLRRLGDYVFSVPAPVRSVVPGPGTGAPPGQRRNQILWQGFSPGRRTLAAWADLRVPESVGALPLRVRVETEVDGRPLAAGAKRSGDLTVTLTLTNATPVTARSYTAEPDAVSLRHVLDRIRAAIDQDLFAEGLNIGIRSRRTRVDERVAAPLRVVGTLRFAPGTAQLVGAPNGIVPVSGELDGLKRSQLRIVLHGRATNASPPKLRLRVSTGDIVEPTAPSAARALLAHTIKLELAYARKRQFDQFLASPEPTGPSETTYVYRTAPKVTADAPPAPGNDDNTVAWILTGVAFALALPAATVIWARS
jgi:hypothetical protein